MYKWCSGRITAGLVAAVMAGLLWAGAGFADEWRSGSFGIRSGSGESDSTEMNHKGKERQKKSRNKQKKKQRGKRERRLQREEEKARREQQELLDQEIIL